MKNFLIRLLGGITPDEFSQLISAHTAAVESCKREINYLKELVDKYDADKSYLQGLILKKTGMIPPERSMPSVEQILNPISTRPKSWREQREALERKDREELMNKWKEKDPTAKLNSEMLEELNQNASEVS